jgi:hypothetical protein
MARYQPMIGEWYRTPDDEVFEVVAVDLDDGDIEIQYVDGTLEELYLDTWNQLAIEPAAPPKGWTGPMDVSREDLIDLEGRSLAHLRKGYDYLIDVDGLT